MKITKQDLIELGHDPEVVEDWFIIRKDKRAPSLTQRAWNSIKKQAMMCGLDEFEIVKVMADNEWRGFKAEWLQNQQAQQQKAQKQVVRQSLRNIHDTNW